MLLDGGEGEITFVIGQKHIRARGQWTRTFLTSQDVLEQEKEKEEKGRSTCVKRTPKNQEARKAQFERYGLTLLEGPLNKEVIHRTLG